MQACSLPGWGQQPFKGVGSLRSQRRKIYLTGMVCMEGRADLMAPRTVSLPRSLRVRLSVGSPSFRMSHHSTLPSVETDMHSVPVLDCSQAKSYTGSLQPAPHSIAMPSALSGQALNRPLPFLISPQSAAMNRYRHALCACLDLTVQRQNSLSSSGDSDMLYLWLCSIGETSTGVLPLRTSK